MPGRGLGGEEGPLEVHVEDPVPEVLLDLEGGGFLLHPGVGDHHVDLAELFHGAVDEVTHGGHVRHVGLHHQPPPAGGLDGLQAGLGFGFAFPVVDDDVRPFPSEPLRDGPADAGAAAGDDGDLVLQTHRGRLRGFKLVWAERASLRRTPTARNATARTP